MIAAAWVCLVSPLAAALADPARRHTLVSPRDGLHRDGVRGHVVRRGRRLVRLRPRARGTRPFALLDRLDVARRRELPRRPDHPRRPALDLHDADRLRASARCIVGYSIGYMDGDDEERRYFAYMALFVFSMLMLVQGGNLLLLLVGWGLVGLSSYLLIGFHHDRPSAVAAAKKAFIMNAFGDATMALAFFLLIQRTGSLEFDSFSWAGGATGWAVSLVALGLLGRSRREVCPAPAPDLAPGCDGGPDAGQRSHPRSDDGHGGRLPARAHRPDLRAARAHPGARGRHRRGDARDGGADRARPGRHQARDRLLDDVPDRLHVPRRGPRRVRELDVPPDDARLLQGAALPRRRDRDPRAPASRTCGRWAGSGASCRARTSRS